MTEDANHDKISKKSSNKIIHRGREEAAPGRYSRRPGFRRGERQSGAATAALARIAADVSACIAEYALSDGDQGRIQRCLGELQEAAQQLGHGWHVRLFGSVANGFATRASDMDATCLRELADPDADEPQEPLSASNLLKEKLMPLLRERPNFQVVEEIFCAKVPILKLRFDGCLDVDLSCQNTLPLRNTQLLKAYSVLDPRVRELGTAVKLWAKAAQVCGAQYGHLSSYTFTLLAIYFMQVHDDVRLPHLPPSAFKADNGGIEEAKLQAARSMWSCRLSVTELLLRFFSFYAREFVWGHEVVSVRLGHRLQTHEQFFKDLRGRWTPRLHVEDPYIVDRNLHVVLGDMEEVQLRAAFANTWFNYLCMGKTPLGLRPAARGGHGGHGGVERRSSEDEEECPSFAKGAEESDAGSHDAAAAVGASAEGSAEASTSAGSRSSISDSCTAESSSSGDEAREEARGGGLQWWQNMASPDVADAILQKVGPVANEGSGAKAESQTPWCITVQDLEGSITRSLGQSGEAAVEVADTRGIVPHLPGVILCSAATSVIAARVANLCLAQQPPVCYQ